VTFKDPEPGEQYVVLESVTTQAIKIIHVIIRQKGGVILGRGPDCGLRITDISVSRCHAKIYWDAFNNCRVRDLDSKFGSGLLIQKPLKLSGQQV
jgi:pSer/pThr/pTyr-binding forkhead associated (FHA) protein